MNSYPRHQIVTWSLALAMAVCIPTGCELANVPEVPEPNEQANLNDNPTPPSEDPSDEVPNGNENGNENENANDNLNPEEPEPEPTIVGKWVVESGKLLAIAPTIDIPAIILNEDGTGNLMLRDSSSGIVDCLSTTYIEFEGEVVINLTLGIGERYQIIQETNDALVLINSANLISVLTRTEPLPVEIDCIPLEVVKVFNDLPVPASFTNLVGFSGALVYSTQSMILGTTSVNPDTGAFADVPAIGGFIQTVQDTAFWTHCGCGGSREATLRTATQTLDQIDFMPELGLDLTVRAMAFDPLARTVFIHGDVPNEGQRLVKVNAQNEPDVLLDSKPLPTSLTAMAWDGTNLWGLTSLAQGIVLRIDPDTGDILERYHVPLPSISMAGVAFIGQRMFLLGTENQAGSQAKGVIAEVRIPAAN